MRVSEKIRKKLRKPLGKLYPSAGSLASKNPAKEIIAVGDQSVLAFLNEGTIPFVSVFDMKSMRKPISAENRKILGTVFPNPVKIRNPKSTISKKLIEFIPSLVESGGALRISGEEDLSALVFIKCAKKNQLVVYGQPGKGLIAVDPSKTRKKAEKILLEISRSCP
ncbi:DUF359 domain-containing protein [Candidatus Micrarchaeota archaeon]|nr:DUF359 domain-containing protein [Candidatus Micrarchaeota archaeon]